LCDDWTKKILRELEKDKFKDVQSSRPHQQNLQSKIDAVSDKINRLIDVYLEGNISLDEYKRKKEEFLNKKREFQEALRDFADEGNNWFEQAKGFVTILNRAGYEAREGNLESQKEFLQKIGSNFILKERRLVFSADSPYRGYLLGTPYPNWRRGWDSNPLSLTHC